MVFNVGFIGGCGSSQVSTDGSKQARIATTLEQNCRGILLADRSEDLPHGDQERGEGDMGGSHAGFSGDCDAGSIGLRLPKRSGRATKREVAYVQVELVSDAQLSGVGKPVLGELPQDRGGVAVGLGVVHDRGSRENRAAPGEQTGAARSTDRRGSDKGTSLNSASLTP
jgi:hypothetical protein